MEAAALSPVPGRGGQVAEPRATAPEWSPAARSSLVGFPASVPPSLSTVCPHPFPQSHKPRAFQQRKPLLVTFQSVEKLSLLKKAGKLPRHLATKFSASRKPRLDPLTSRLGSGWRPATGKARKTCLNSRCPIFFSPLRRNKARHLEPGC